MRRALGLLLNLLAFLLGGVFLAYYWDETLLARLLEFAKEWPREARLLAAGLATILLLGPPTILLRYIRANRRAKVITYENESGRVAVNLLAIEEALTRALEHEDCVRKAHVHLYDDRVRRQVVIEASMTFWEVPNVTERNRQCQQLLRRRFSELMPEQKVVVNLSVSRITPRRERSASVTQAVASPASAPQPPPPPSPFAGTPLADQAQTATAPAVGMYLAPPDHAAGGRTPAPLPGREDDLYVGPSYPVTSETEDESSGENYIGRPLPVTERTAKSASRSGRKSH